MTTDNQSTLVVIKKNGAKKADEKTVAATAAASKKNAKHQKKTRNGKPHDQLILAKLAYYHDTTIKVNWEMIARECGFHVRTKTAVAAMKDLEEDGLVVKENGHYKLTEKGLEAIGANDCQRVIPTSNEEYHAQIKSKLMPKGPIIIDLLLNKSPQHRNDLAAGMNMKSGTHSFSYALKQLKDLGYVCEAKGGKGKLLQLSHKAFLKKPIDDE